MSAAQSSSSNLFDCRDAFAAALDRVAERDNRIVIVVNDSIGSSKLAGFRKRWPERTINVGIAEQNMVGVGSGLANGGKVPFVSAASCFLTARALEQIKADVAYTNANVKLVGQSPGVGYGELGPTHHSIEDMGWLRLLPNLAIIAPSDPWETAQAVEAAAAHEGPVFLRISRFGVPQVAAAGKRSIRNRQSRDASGRQRRRYHRLRRDGCASAGGRRSPRRRRRERPGREYGVDCPARPSGHPRRCGPGGDRHRRGAFGARRSRRRGRGGRHGLPAMPGPHPRFSGIHADWIAKVPFRKVRADVGPHRKGRA